MTRPPPFTPADLDLRNFPYMGLDVVRLRDSVFAVVTTGDEFRAGVLLWAAAWHQVPAASLPNDDRLLANLAGFGRNVDDWLVVRDRALHGFIECDDGRLYHPVVAEKALDAESTRLAYRARTAKATESRRASLRKRDEHRDVDRDDHHDDPHLMQRDVHQGKGKERKGEEGKSSNKIKTAVVVSTVPVKKPEGPESTTKTTEEPINSIEEISSARVTNNPLGTALPEDWIPDEACIEVARDHGMTDIEGEVLRFQALNAQRGTFSQNWSKTWTLWCAEFKRRTAEKAAKAPPRVEVSANYEPTTRDWDFAAKMYRGNGRWNIQLGPEPTSRACRCPSDILTKYGINLATDQTRGAPSMAADPK
jgi:hypothetical protein